MNYRYRNELFTINNIGRDGITSIPIVGSSQGTPIVVNNIISLDNTLLQDNINFEDGFNGEIYSIDRQTDESIIITGNITSYNSLSLPVNKICRLNADGTLDESFP